MEQQRDGTKYYVKNPKGLNIPRRRSTESVPQGTKLELISHSIGVDGGGHAVLRIIGTADDSFSINNANFQRNCRPERRYDGFSDPICPKRRNELLTEQDCPFRKEDTPNEARDLMMRVVNDKLRGVLNGLFMP